jgi:hypothetical protein
MSRKNETAVRPSLPKDTCPHQPATSADDSRSANGQDHEHKAECIQPVRKAGMLWFACGTNGTLHMVGPCPHCQDTKWGLLLGTMNITFTGIVRTSCGACHNEVDYYVDAAQQQVWKPEAVKPILN